MNRLSIGRCEGELVGPLVQPGKDRGPTGRADRGGHEHATERTPSLAKRSRVGVSKTDVQHAQAIPAVIVDRKKMMLGCFSALPGLGRGKREGGHDGEP